MALVGPKNKGGFGVNYFFKFLFNKALKVIRQLDRRNDYDYNSSRAFYEAIEQLFYK